jgi:hypothetical protein
MNGIVVDKQYSFGPNMSTEIASYKLINEILVAVNNKMPLGGLYFVTWRDCINHRIILDKFEFYWIVGKFNLLRQSYLYEISKNTYW